MGFWWNGGWDHYDPGMMKGLDEIVVFAVAPDAASGGINTFSNDKESGLFITGEAAERDCQL